MAVDVAVLERHRRYEDPAGFTEEFLQPVLGLGRTVAVLSSPVGHARSTGWVICHSLGLEQIHLGRLDVIAARALAASGFPVLRFHGQGYGDSERSGEVIGLSSHLAEAMDAVELMSRQEGVERVGVLGARFGGTVAALVADRLGLPLMGLWDPAVKGAMFIRDLLRRELLANVAAGEGPGGASEMEQMTTELATQGWTDIRGFLLTKDAFDGISGVDLVAGLTGFRGAALVLGVSRTGKPSASLTKLGAHLRSLGAACTVETLEDQFAAQFGHYRFQTIDGGRGKRDVQLPLNDKISASTTEWAIAGDTP